MEIRIYIEGGGDSKDTKAFLRQGFGIFLRDLNAIARRQRHLWHVVTCGPRNAAFDMFRIATKQHPEAFNLLLVDSEAAIATTPWKHLQQHDGWDAGGFSDDHCHLMAQAMEAWLIADRDAVARFYGQNFHGNNLPGHQNVEQIPKAQLEAALKNATRQTQKGEYHKIQHAWKLLQEVNPSTVRQAAPHCDRLFLILTEKMS